MDYKVKALIQKFDETGKFSVESIELDEHDAKSWVEFVTDPNRFTPDIFDGLWAKQSSYPAVGSIRVIRVIKGKDGVTRAIGRQDKKIFASPWL